MHLINVQTDTEARAVEVSRQCASARQYVLAGDYPAACRALDTLWGGVGVRPADEGLPRAVWGEVLLWVGALTCYLGGTEGVAGPLEQAKGLLFEAWEILASEGLDNKAAEAGLELAVCYRREGAINEARDILKDARSRIKGNLELRALASIRLSFVEVSAGRADEAIRLLTEDRSLFESLMDDSLRGRFYSHLGSAFFALGEQERSYYRSARIEFLKANEHFKKSGHSPHSLCTVNNMAMVSIVLGDFEAAHSYVAQAIDICHELKDRRSLAAVEETRGRLHLAEGRIEEALGALAGDIAALELSDDRATLAEALCTYGIALARVERIDDALEAFRRAAREAESVGCFPHAERARAEIAKLTKPPNVASLHVHWRINDDSMERAGLHKGKAYKFRATQKWQRGDIVAVETPIKKLIAYIQDAPPFGVILRWANPRLTPQWFAKTAVKVRGVLQYKQPDSE